MTRPTNVAEQPVALAAPLSCQRNATRWWVRWGVRLLIWSVVALACLVGYVVNFVMLQPLDGLLRDRPQKWVCLDALPPELQHLFDGDWNDSLQMSRQRSHRSLDHVEALALALNLQWFVDVETRRAMALNLSPVRSLDKPYKATLEDLASSGFEGLWLVKGELHWLEVRGRIAKARRDQVEQHLEKLKQHW